MFNSISEGEREGGGGRIYKSILNVIYKSTLDNGNTRLIHCKYFIVAVLNDQVAPVVEYIKVYLM
jgi:hypothetical protein